MPPSASQVQLVVIEYLRRIRRTRRPGDMSALVEPSDVTIRQRLHAIDKALRSAQKARITPSEAELRPSHAHKGASAAGKGVAGELAPAADAQDDAQTDAQDDVKEEAGGVGEGAEDELVRAQPSSPLTKLGRLLAGTGPAPGTSASAMAPLTASAPPGFAAATLSSASTGEQSRVAIAERLLRYLGAARSQQESRPGPHSRVSPRAGSRRAVSLSPATPSTFSSAVYSASDAQLLYAMQHFAAMSAPLAAGAGEGEASSEGAESVADSSGGSGGAGGYVAGARGANTSLLMLTIKSAIAGDFAEDGRAPPMPPSVQPTRWLKDHLGASAPQTGGMSTNASFTLQLLSGAQRTQSAPKTRDGLAPAHSATTAAAERLFSGKLAKPESARRLARARKEGVQLLYAR